MRKKSPEGLLIPNKIFSGSAWVQCLESRGLKSSYCTLSALELKRSSKTLKAESQYLNAIASYASPRLKDYEYLIIERCVEFLVVDQGFKRYIPFLSG